MKEYYDVIIVGTGAAGLYCALNLPERKRILLITKQEADQSDSFLAQGGICMLRGEDDYQNYFEENIHRLENYPELLTDVKELFSAQDFHLKSKAVNILAIFKQSLP